MAKAILYILGPETGDDHSTNANFIANRLKKKTGKYTYDRGKVPIISDSFELRDYLVSTAGRDVVKIYVLSHGNQEEIQGWGGKGDKNEWFNGEKLAEMLWRRGLRHLANLDVDGSIKLVLVTCMSGAPHPKTKKIYAQQVASTLEGYTKKRTIVVKGMNGLSVTTNTGSNLVWTGDLDDHKALDQAMNIAKGDYSKLPPEIRSKLSKDSKFKPQFTA